MRPARPRALRDQDALDTFDCGNETLNAWLTSRARRNDQTGDSRTYISIDLDTGRVAGYYSLAPWAVAREAIGGGRLARNAPDPVSVILLGRLAVATAAQGHGLGRDLLADALHNATLGASILGARALVTEAIDENAGRFYAHHGFTATKARPDLYVAKLPRPSASD